MVRQYTTTITARYISQVEKVKYNIRRNHRNLNNNSQY